MIEYLELSEIKQYLKNDPELFFKLTSQKKDLEKNENDSLIYESKLFNYMPLLEILEKKEGFNEEFFNLIFNLFSTKPDFDLNSLAPEKDLSLFLVKHKFFESLKMLKSDFPLLVKYNCILFSCCAFDNMDFEKFKNIFNDSLLKYDNCLINIIKTRELKNSFNLVAQLEDDEKMERLKYFYDSPLQLIEIIKRYENDIVYELENLNKYFNFKSLESLKNFKVENDHVNLFHYLLNKNRISVIIKLLETDYDLIKESHCSDFNDFKRKIETIKHKSKQRKEINKLYGLANIHFEKKELNSKINLKEFLVLPKKRI